MLDSDRKEDLILTQVPDSDTYSLHPTCAILPSLRERPSNNISRRTPAAECPIEIVETIIDLCYGDTQTLRACALTCRSWLSRSLHNLYRKLVLRNYDQLDHFATLVTSRPAVCHGVEDMQIHHSSRYKRILPVFLTSLASKLEQWKSLELVGTWDRCPLRVELFADALHSAPSFASVTRLSLFRITLDALPDLAHLMFFFPRLLELKCIDISWKDRRNTHGVRVQSQQFTNLTSLHLDMGHDSLAPFIECLLGSGLQLNLNELTLRGVASESDTGRVGALLQRVEMSIRHLLIELRGRQPVARAVEEFVIKMCTQSSASKTLIEKSLREAESFQETDMHHRRRARRYSHSDSTIPVRRLGLSHAIALESLEIRFAAPYEKYEGVTSTEAIGIGGLNRLIHAYIFLCELSSRSVRRIVVDLGLCMYGSETHALAADTLLSSIDEALAQARFDDLRSFTLKSGLVW